MSKGETTVRVGMVLPGAGLASLGASEIAFDSAGRIAALTALPRDALTAREAELAAMPALANAHDHGRGVRTLACGIPDGPLESWMIDLARQPRVDAYETAALAFARMAGSGVGAVYHCHNTQDGTALLAEAEAVSRAARDVGIRVAFGWPFFDANPLAYGSHDQLALGFPAEQRHAIATMAERLRDCATNMALFAEAQAFEHEFFNLHYHPVAPQWARPDTLAAIAQASAGSGRRIHTHLLETRLQREWADHRFPDGFVPWLDSIGLLSPRLTVAHGVWLRPDEIALLAERGVTLSVNVSSNLRLRSGLPPLAEVIAGGLAMGLGMDGMALDDDEDMLREIRLANLLIGQPCSHGPVAPPHIALEAAWQGGRRAILGEDGGGIIAVGAPADMLVIDTGAIMKDSLRPDLCPDLCPDPALLLARATRDHVARLIVGGRDVVRDGRVIGVDEGALADSLLRAARTAPAPDEAAIARMHTAVGGFYASGHHRT